MISFETTVNNIAVGDQVFNPFNEGERLLVRDIQPGMYGLIELTGLDIDGDRHVLSLLPSDSIKVLDA
jgi:hypothetical protein